MDRFRPNCGNNVSDAKFCSKCGKEVEASSVSNSAMNSPNKTINKPHNTMGNVPTKPSVKKGCAIGCLTILILLAGFLVLLINIAPSIETTVKTSTQLIQDAIGITEEQAKVIEDILLQCEVTDISEVTYKPKLDEDNIKICHVFFKNGVNFKISKGYLYISDGIIKEFYYSDYKLYGDGQVVNKVSDYALSLEEEVDLKMKCEKAIEAMLVSLSTAKFAPVGDWDYKKVVNIKRVQGYVDSQNGFGAMIRSEFQVKFEDGTLISLIFDGEEYIK